MAKNKIPASIIASAKQSQADTGLLAAVTLAQWALESGWGKSMPKDSNNCFGMKWVPNCGYSFVESQTDEYVNGKEVTLVARFIQFPSIEECFDYHGKELMDPTGPYANALPYKNDLYAYIQRMAPIYATNSKYASTLIEIIEENNLAQYD